MRIHNSGFVLVIFVLIIFTQVGILKAGEKDKDPEKSIFHSIDFGFMAGGQSFTQKIINETGWSFNHAVNKKINSKVYYGIGWGYEKLDTESFLPLTVNFTGFLKKKKNAAFMVMQMGYAMAWDTEFTNHDKYSFHGGITFKTGIGRNFEIADRYYLRFSFIYNHQFARLSYLNYEDEKHSENLNFDLISIKTGFMF